MQKEASWGLSWRCPFHRTLTWPDAKPWAQRVQVHAPRNNVISLNRNTPTSQPPPPPVCQRGRRMRTGPPTAHRSSRPSAAPSCLPLAPPQGRSPRPPYPCRPARGCRRSAGAGWMAPRRVHKVQEVEAHQGRVHCAAWDRASLPSARYRGGGCSALWQRESVAKAGCGFFGGRSNSLNFVSFISSSHPPGSSVGVGFAGYLLSEHWFCRGRGGFDLPPWPGGRGPDPLPSGQGESRTPGTKLSRLLSAGKLMLL